MFIKSRLDGRCEIPFGFQRWRKTEARSASFWAYIFINYFRIMPENFVSRSSRVRSPGQVKWRYLQRSLWCYSSYSCWSINMKLSADIIRPSVATKRTSSTSYFSYMRWGQFCSLPIIRQWVKKIPPIRILSLIYPSYTLIYWHELSYISLLLIIQV